MPLQRKKITVHSKRGKTYQRSVMVKAGPTLKDNGHLTTNHEIWQSLRHGDKSLDAASKKADKAIAAIRMAHTHGNAGAFNKRLNGKKGWLAPEEVLRSKHVGYELARHYGTAVMRANPGSNAKLYMALKDSGYKTGFMGHVPPEVFGHTYAQWVSARSSGGGIRHQHGNVRLNAAQFRAASKVLDVEFRQGRGR